MKEFKPSSLVGIATLTFRDSKTMEVLRTVEKTNTINNRCYWGGVLGGSANYTTKTANSSIEPGLKTIAVSERKWIGGVQTVSNVRNLSNIFKESTEQSPWTLFPGSPSYIEKTGRFSAPGTARVINSIHLVGGSVASYQAGSTVTLSTPCTQSTSEVLDITYRIQFFNQASTGGVFPIAPSYNDEVIDGILNARIGGKPLFAGIRWMGAPSDSSLLHGTIMGDSTGAISTNLTGPRTIHKDHFKSTFENAVSISQYNGNVIKSIGYGGKHAQFLNAPVTSGVVRSVMWSKFAPAGFQNLPIQNIHNHSAGAIEWGLDVDFLATSQGTLSVDGSAWTDPDWPYLYRIDHTTTGPTGTSRYAFRTRVMAGFDGNSYMSSTNSIIDSAWSADNATVSNVTTVTGGHGCRKVMTTEEYDATTYVGWDEGESGITMFGLRNTEVHNFDATTTPAVPGTVKQVAVDGNMNLWVATVAGLYRIQDPTGTPVVTQMTVATNGLPGTSAYGVAVGFGNTIWAVVDGGLVETSDPNGATPSFTTHDSGSVEPFSYTGISDNNWSRVQYIAVDREHADNQMIVVSEQVANRQLCTWWSTATAATTGYDTGNISALSYERYGIFRCSNRSSVFTVRTSTLGFNPTVLSFNTTSTERLSSTSSNAGHTQIFYDYYDVPHYLGYTGTRLSVYTMEDKNIGSAFTTTAQTSSVRRVGLSFQNEASNGLFIFAGSSGDSLPQRMWTVNNETNEDALNGQYSATEEFVWKKYHWNGTAWEENYYQDAIDTASHTGGPYNADRHNFDTEDHTFTGRSLIDATSAFASNNFASSANATFAFTLVPEAKLSVTANDTPSRQEAPRTILDISDATQQFKVLWDDSMQGSLKIVEDGIETTVTSTPANSASQRLVVTVSGTTVTVYLNGSAVGSTVTLSNAYDWDNTSSDLIAYIGSRVYKWNNASRNKALPYDFYRGTMSNIQLWNVAWDSTDVTNDFTDITGVIVSKPIANLVARYELTQSLVGTETKLSHTASEVLKDGITISFASTDANAFVATDYHTFGVVDGLLKDNATSFTHKHGIYAKPVDFTFSEFTNNVGTNLVDATTKVITEKAIFTSEESTPNNSVSTTTTYSDTVSQVKIPGQLGSDVSGVIGSYTTGEGAITAQPITADGYFEAAPGMDDAGVVIGLTTGPSSLHRRANTEFMCQVNTDGTVDVYEGSTLASAAATTVNIEDVLRIERVGTVITYSKVIAGTATVFYTSTTTSSGTLYGRVMLGQEGNLMGNAVIQYVRPAHLLAVGNDSTLTGTFHADYLRVDTENPDSIQITIGGVPASVIISDEYYDNMTTPGGGQVVVNGETGWLSFNPADLGSAIAGTVAVIYNK